MNERSGRYFAAANTANGFFSQFPELFDAGSGAFEKIYILKGGPGTGKSSFMNRFAELAEQRGDAVERYHCSSDTTSLDGVSIPSRGIAMLDGTAPHTVDPRYPGAVEEIINLGMFFDVEKLREHAEAIRALCAENSLCHRRAARYLSAAGRVREIRCTMNDSAFLAKKAKAAAKRILSHCKSEKEAAGPCETRFLSANSAQGIVHLYTAEQSAGNVFYVGDRHLTASAVLGAVISAAEEYGISCTRYADPLLPMETEGIYLPGMDTLYMTDRYGSVRSDAGRLNSLRFFDNELLAATREKRRFAAKCEAALTAGAYEALAAAGKLHDGLEQYYIRAMDFPALNAFEERFLRSVFG